MVVVHDIVLDLGGHLAMYMLGLMLLDVDGGQGLRSAEDAVVDAREDITLEHRDTEVRDRMPSSDAAAVRGGKENRNNRNNIENKSPKSNLNFSIFGQTRIHSGIRIDI